jgi:hypothetical protein
MTPRFLTPTALLAVVFAVVRQSAVGQSTATDQRLAAIVDDYQGPITQNRLGLNYRMGLNISVDFRKLGGLALSDPGPATGSTVNRNYDNGYNRVDSSTNAGGVTWYWGYEHSQSVQGTNLILNSYSTPASATSKDREDDPQHGLEVTYSRELLRHKWWRFGAEGGLGYSPISITDHQTLKNKAFRTNDTFSLNGTIPPGFPYHGTFEGPGDLISSDPIRTTDVLARAATITGERDIDADVFVLRFGPYFEVPFYKKFSLILNGGLTLAYAHTKFSFDETVTISDPANDIELVSPRRKGSGSHDDFLVGGYAGAALNYQLTREVGLMAGAQYQAAGRTINRQKGKESLLDLGQSIVVTVGVTYSF